MCGQFAVRYADNRYCKQWTWCSTLKTFLVRGGVRTQWSHSTS